MKPVPAWQEILLLNYRERLATARTQAEVMNALTLAIRDTAYDVIGSYIPDEPDLGAPLWLLRHMTKRA